MYIICKLNIAGNHVNLERLKFILPCIYIALLNYVFWPQFYITLLDTHIHIHTQIEICLKMTIFYKKYVLYLLNILLEFSCNFYVRIFQIFSLKSLFSETLESFSLKLALFITLNNLFNILYIYTYEIIHETVTDDDC